MVELNSILGTEASKLNDRIEKNALRPVKWYASRAAAVAAATATDAIWAVGAQIAAEQCVWQYNGDSTAIVDMPGWVPAGIPTPPHFGVPTADDSTAVLLAWIAYVVTVGIGKVPADYHGKTAAELVIPIVAGDGLTIYGTGTIEQTTWGYSGFQVFANDVTIVGPNIISTQDRAVLSTSLANRYYGEVARARSAAVFLMGANNPIIDIRSSGFVSAVQDLGAYRIYRTGLSISASSATTLPLAAADQQVTDDYYAGWIVRPLGGADTSYRRITAYSAATNTITVDAAWSIALTGVSAYFLMASRATGGVFRVLGDTFDFGIVQQYRAGFSVSWDMTNITQLQDLTAPPHALYCTGDGLYVNCVDVAILSNKTLNVQNGSAIKCRGVVGINAETLHVYGARACIEIENCNALKISGMMGYNLGANTLGNALGYVISGGRDISIGASVFQFSDTYASGTVSDVASMRPIGVLVEGMAAGLTNTPTNIRLGPISMEFNHPFLTGIGLHVSNDSGVTAVLPTRITCDDIEVRNLGLGGVVVGARVTYGSNVRATVRYLSGGASQQICKFDAGATACAVRALYAVGTVANSGSGCRVDLSETPRLTADLPTAAQAGIGGQAVVTDASSPSWGATLTGGGATVAAVRSNGANWIIG